VQEPIDAGPGRPPLIRAEDDRVISFEFSILGGEMRDDMPPDESRRTGDGDAPAHSVFS